jgi:hypothetical protein
MVRPPLLRRSRRGGPRHDADDRHRSVIRPLASVAGARRGASAAEKFRKRACDFK